MKIATFLFFLGLIYTNAQEVSQAIFISDMNQTPISNLEVSLLKKTDSITLTSDKAGKIIFKANTMELVKIIISTNHFDYYEEEIAASANPKYIYLSEIFEVDEIILSTRKQNITRSLGTTTLQIDDSPYFQNANFLEIIPLIPEVMVENGNIKILGKNNILYLVNNMESSLHVQDLQANQIEKIEVISNPSAQYQSAYDAVINIVLKNKEENGWFLNFNTRVYRNRATSNFNSLDLGFKKNKWSITNRFKYNFQNDLIYTKGWQDYSDRFENYNTEEETNKEYLENATHINYTLNSENEIGLDFNLSKNPINRSHTVTESDFYLFNTLSNQLITSNIDADTDYTSINTSLYHMLSKEKSSLSTYVNFIQNNQDFNNLITSRNSSNLLLNHLVRSTNENHTLIFNSDYQYQINEKNTLKTGVRFSNFDGNYGIFGAYSISTAPPTLFDFTENVYSVYGEYQYQLNRFNFAAGLRYEYFNRDVTFNNTQKNNKSDGNLFPSARVGYTSKNEKNQWELSYTKKIQRPKFSDITPFEYDLNYNTLFRGNPQLENEIIHSLELNYSYNQKLFIIPYFNHHQDYIERVTTFENNNLVWYPANYEVNNFGVLMAYDFQLFNNKLTFYNQVSVDYNENLGNVNGVKLSTSLWQYQLYLTQTYQLSEKMGITLVSFYISPQLADFYEIEQGYKMDLKFSTKLMKDKIDASINFYDILNTYFYEPRGNYNGFESYKHTDFSLRAISISFRYNFQSGKNVKENSIEIDNLDEQERLSK